MKKHVALIFCLLLAGCTDADWDRTLNYVYPASDDAAVTSEVDGQPAAASAHAASTAPAAISSTAASTEQPANADFCRAVATQDATANGFDQETQQRVFARSYGQCVAIYSR
jgi:predicted component of type VI protein secretion system